MHESNTRALQHLLGFNPITKDNSMQGIGNTTEYFMQAPMIQLPEFYPVFNYDETTKRLKDELKQETVDRFNAEFASKLKGKALEVYNNFLAENKLAKVSSLQHIDQYNKFVTDNNRKETLSHMNLDPFNIIHQFIVRSYEYGTTSKFMDTYRLLRDVVSSNSFEARTSSMKNPIDTFKSKMTGKQQLKTKKGSNTNISKQVDAAIKTLVQAPIVTNTMEQYLNSLRGITSMTYMHFNLLAGINNVSVGLTNVLMEAKAGEFIDSKTLKNAIGAYFNSLTDLISNLKSPYTDNKEVAFIKHFEDIYDDKNESLYDKTKRSAVSNAVYKLNDFGYLSNNIGEHFLQFNMLLACARSHRVVGGQILSYNQYINSLRMTQIEKVLTADQYKNLSEFIKTSQDKSDKPEAENDFVRDWFVKNISDLTPEQIKDIHRVIKAAKKEAKSKFETYKTVHELSEIKNGRLSFPEGSISPEELARFGRKVQKINHFLHGIYNNLDRNMISMTAMGSMAMQFRKWMKPAWDRMYGAKFFGNRFNEGTQVYQHGSFAAMFNLFRKPFLEKYSKTDNKIIGALQSIMYAGYESIAHAQIYMDVMTPTERAAILRQCRNFNILMGVTVAMMIAASLLGDDDESKQEAIKDNYLASMAFYLMNSTQADLGQLYPMGWVPGLLRMQQNVVAGESLLLKYYKLGKDLVQYPFLDQYDTQYHTGMFNGQTKIKIDAEQALPTLRQFVKMDNLTNYAGYYKMYNYFAVPIK